MDHRDTLPEDVQRFILLGIPSVPYLEALLLMRADPARAWTCPQVARHLYLPEKATHAVLAELAAAGVTAPAVDGDSRDAVRYAPTTPKLKEMIDRVAEIYPRQIVAVSELIHSRARQNRAQQFADAFVLRKENS